MMQLFMSELAILIVCWFKIVTSVISVSWKCRSICWLKFFLMIQVSRKKEEKERTQSDAKKREDWYIES